MNNVELYARAAETALSVNSRYTNNRARRSDLFNFMDANEWFGIQPELNVTDIIITADEYALIEPSLALWLKAYKQPGDVKISLMLEAYGGVYPETCALFRSFIIGKDVNSSHTYWQLLDFVLAEIDRDIIEYSEDEIEALAQTASATLTLQTARLFSDFLNNAKSKARTLSQWVYTFEPRAHPGLNGDAYAFDDYAIMAYCVYNEEAWQSQSMIEKAIERKAFADLWLFVALHLICALRSGDMERIPSPRLPYGADAIRGEILSCTFPARCAAALSDEMVARFKFKSMKPSKTRRKSNVPELKLSVQESLRVPLGIIIAIALTHQPEIFPGGGFVRPDNSLYNIRAFFGEHFVKALGTRRFSSRRANKSYLQGIELMANVEGAPGKPKGYMLAALARSHGGGIGALAKTTDIYLKDANFSGYTPEFIAREMFERGVFGFIPAVLLEMYAGKKYKALPVGVQTKLIGALGLSPQQIERTGDAVERSLSKSRRMVADFFKEGGDAKANVFLVLQNIASGNAPGKQDGYLCLMTAATRRCPYPGRGACIGCGYEIFTKTALQSLIGEYVRISAMLDMVPNAVDKMRYGKLLECALYPSIKEFIESAQILYPEINADVLSDILEEGMDYADRAAREICGTPRALASDNSVG